MQPMGITISTTKPDKSIRLCVDYRKLNGVTVSDLYYMPMLDDIVSK